MTKKPIERLIYSNCDDDCYREGAIENLELNGINNPSEQEIDEEIAEMQNEDYALEKEALEKIIDGRKLIVAGSVQRWNGTRHGGQIYDSFESLVSDFGQDCAYFKYWDENGHLFMTCSHHDGTNSCEIKILTKAGENYYDNWDYGLDKRLDKYNEFQIIERLFNSSKYAILPNFMHLAYECPKREYEEVAA